MHFLPLLVACRLATHSSPCSSLQLSTAGPKLSISPWPQSEFGCHLWQLACGCARPWLLRQLYSACASLLPASQQGGARLAAPAGEQLGSILVLVRIYLHMFLFCTQFDHRGRVLRIPAPQTAKRNRERSVDGRSNGVQAQLARYTSGDATLAEQACAAAPPPYPTCCM